ncbi:MAG TPA: nucleotide sugar dehydrogenase [Candidatus Cloacimonadota bacterium]|jgi:nucleotide sugar dehydrogenase|nr:nucleotide sugar dehydrogenase [Candidatus Cloacimonadota bacterium]HOG31581.1 nucleotide sugar dehydrogenase [Candidatus Cloacimonadota bacterium]HOR59543.1 nucleotide sugar dehydrogenase [Candidatus Cloacimonadota bacterium]HPB08810.1 nucleotide sugar dehydrogenase [Candidatus Cloacimonadota bacterium]HPL23846.1 nucleotide sugar dehydrogenase [Candidatus Cloacimonadota bacterium]
MLNVSIAPDGKKYPLPTEQENEKEREILKQITAEQRKLGRKIVAVQGLGFVGCVMATVVADATDKDGNPYYFVHGHQRASKRSYWKVPVINSGVPPVASSDPEVPQIFHRTVVEKKNFRATSEESVYGLVDVVVVDIQLDATKPSFGEAEKGYCDLLAFREGIRTLGQHIRPDCLVLVETTVPPGTCEKVVKPILEEEFTKRGIDIAANPPLVAHSYERVMPGAKYVASIRDFWRVFSGVNEKSIELCREFLSNCLNVEEYPLTQLDSTNASELAKTMENTYRAVNIALTLEWASFAEQIGVDIFKVREAIRKRKGTHDNLLRPSLGVGGYCLTKDPVLANWAMQTLFGLEGSLEMAIRSVNINDTMPLHTIEIIKREFESLSNLKVAVLGVSYLENVGDTRHSPSKTLVEFLRKEFATALTHDPYVEAWPELDESKVESDLNAVLPGADVVIFAVGHDQYKGLKPAEVVAMCGTKPLIVDCSNFLSDATIAEYKKLGCKVRGVGKGHIV